MSATDASAFAGHEELVAELRANQPVATDRLRERVLSVGQARRRSSRRRLVLVVVPVAVALAVGAALVQGFVSSGSRPGAANTAVFHGPQIAGTQHNVPGPAVASGSSRQAATPAFKAHVTARNS